MAIETASIPSGSGTPEEIDIVIVGAGLSGIDAGYRFQTECPGKSYAILEAREPEYRRAHAQIDTSGRAVEECVAELAETAARLFAGGG